MPNFHFTKEQARALTFYMLSLTSEQMGTYYSSVRLIPSAGYGRRVVRRKELHRLPQHRRRGSKERARPAGSHQTALPRLAGRATGEPPD